MTIAPFVFDVSATRFVMNLPVLNLCDMPLLVVCGCIEAADYYVNNSYWHLKFLSGVKVSLTLYRRKGPFPETAAGAAHDTASPACHCPHCARPWPPEQTSWTQQRRAARAARTQQVAPVPCCVPGGFRWRAAKHRSRQPSLSPPQPALPDRTTAGRSTRETPTDEKKEKRQAGR